MEDEVGVDFPKDRMLVTQCSTDGPADEGVTLDTPTMEDTSASSGFLGPTEGFPTERCLKLLFLLGVHSDLVLIYRAFTSVFLVSERTAVRTSIAG